MWTLTIPVLSTVHISQAADEFLHDFNKGCLWNAVASWEGGHFIYVDGCGPHEGLNDVLNWAIENKHDWIRLDRDGDVVPELPQHEW